MGSQISINPESNVVDTQKSIVQRANKSVDKADNSLQVFVKYLKSFAVLHAAFLGFKELLGTTVDKAEYNWINATKVIAGIGFFTGIPKLLSNMKLAARAETALERIEHIANSVLTSAVLVGAGASLIEGLKSFGYIAKDSFKWSAGVTGIFLPLQAFTTEFGLSEILKTNKLRNKLIKELLITKPAASNKTLRIQDVTRACNYIIENAEELQDTLIISKKEALSDRSKAILEDLTSANRARVGPAILEAKDLTRLLKARVSTKLSFKIASGAMKVVALAMSAISFVFLPIASGWIAMTAVGAIGISILITEKVVMHKRPITEPMSKPAYKMQQKLFHAGAKVQNIVQGAVGRDIPTAASAA